MAAYIIVEHKITDPAKFEEYRVKVGPMIASAFPDRVAIGKSLPDALLPSRFTRSGGSPERDLL